MKDGGPAFPKEAYVNPHGVVIHTGTAGMSLRDWFAGQADIGTALSLLHKEGCEELIGRAMPSDFPGMLVWQFDVIARLRLMAADAMLAARESNAD